MQRELLSAAGAKTDAEFRGKLLKFRQFQQYKEVYDQTEAHIRSSPRILKAVGTAP